MKVLTYNLWHGKAPAEGVFFVSLEPSYRRHERQEKGLAELRAGDFDILLLQELDPLQTRARDIAALLERKYFVQGDSVGFKFLQLGWPFNLNSGIGVFVKHEWPARIIESVKLSGAPLSKISPVASWQWTESRYALLVEVIHPSLGPLLVINCHLHHSLELSAELNQKIDKLVKDGIISTAAAYLLRERLAAPNRRREKETIELLAKIESYKAQYPVILLGGDFNFTSASGAYGLITESGFKDLWCEVHGEAGGDGAHGANGATIDTEKNYANNIFNKQFPLQIELEDLSFSPKGRQLLTEMLKQHELRSRRVDYLFLQTRDGALRPRAVKAELFGTVAANEMAPSDHFGVSALLEWK